ncbi:GNAT family N-acetyltransferase [Yinghuangia seranimata]|uniref:GNAT family N-acetyltransferase n=1 Tax=Yinghuangia seranimata TaxID=408067 RepID=UPI00248AEBF6|nr:GNAT family N-acetyltransferase [Yinghuangia seranimata]MDI2126694.1 GNAT family N-acetyltransferase [Yinghuangia seranimata]
MGQNVRIGAADVSDAEQILKLQYLCYQGEAALYNDYGLAPLTQSLESLTAEFATHVVLVARLGDEVVGSVRGVVEDGVARIGRLVVHPRLQGHGLGTRLLHAVEAKLPGATSYELFTGHRSEDNLRLYARLGYAESRVERIGPRLSLVYLTKSAALAA